MLKRDRCLARENVQLREKLDEERVHVQRLRDLLDENREYLRRALERINSAINSGDATAHDWKAEAGGLAYMITDIHGRYIMAKQYLGGDSELLASSIHQAERWVNGPMLEYYASDTRTP